jgi:hypothetical protein
VPNNKIIGFICPRHINADSAGSPKNVNISEEALIIT